MTVGALAGGYATFRWDALALCLVTSIITLGAGYSVGIHRLLIHNSFQCPQWLENSLVYLGVLVGTEGPYSAIERHDIHEWAQQQPSCHSYFSHSQNPFTDWLWSLHCDIQLTYPPILRYEPRVAQNTFYQWLEQTRIVQQLPWAVAFYYFGGWSWVFWGIYVRIALCANLQWATQYAAHHYGNRPLSVGSRGTGGAYIQRRNLPWCGLFTLGEGWQNNHQMFPTSARFSFGEKQCDPGWWFIRALQSVGLAWNVNRPKIRPQRKIRSLAMEPNPQPVQMQSARQEVGVK